MSDWLTSDEAGAILGCHVSNVPKLITKGGLNAGVGRSSRVTFSRAHFLPAKQEIERRSGRSHPAGEGMWGGLTSSATLATAVGWRPTLGALALRGLHEHAPSDQRPDGESASLHPTASTSTRTVRAGRGLAAFDRRSRQRTGFVQFSIDTVWACHPRNSRWRQTLPPNVV